MSKMWVVGITGHSGSGKSSLAGYYASLGYPMADGDELSRAVCTAGSPCVQELKKAFGSDIVDEEGNLLRRTLGEKVYGDAALNTQLMGISHPFLLEELKNREKAAEATGAKFFFLDGAMLVGSIFEAHCKRIIVVECNTKLTISRIILRDKISKAAAHNRLNAQKTTQELRQAASYLIENDGSLNRLHQKADAVLHQLEKEYAAHAAME